MQNKLKHAFKETPERFRYAVNAAIREAEQSASLRRRPSKRIVIAIVIILILALVPAAVFGASRIIGGMNAEKIGSCGVKITADVDAGAVYPDYVKITIQTPEGFAEVPNTEGMKYYSLSAEEPYTDGFSVDLFRPDPSGTADIADYADGYEQMTVAGHTAYKIIPLQNQKGWNRIYVYYEDVNVMLLVYYKDVTENQLNEFIKGISVTEGTADDHPVGSRIGSSENAGISDGSIYQPEPDYIEKPLDTVFTFSSYDENGMIVDRPAVSCTVTNVRTVDNIGDLDKDDLNDLYSPDKIADENGRLLPRTRELWDFGDGIDTADVLLDSESAAQKLLLIDFSYSNLTDESRTVFIPWTLSAMEKDESARFRSAEVIDKENEIMYPQLCSGEIFYLSRHGEGKSFYTFTLDAGETAVVTAGYLIDADMLDKFYLSECPSSDGVLSPDYPRENPYTYFLMKVQNDD